MRPSRSGCPLVGQPLRRVRGAGSRAAHARSSRGRSRHGCVATRDAAPRVPRRLRAAAGRRTSCRRRGGRGHSAGRPATRTGGSPHPQHRSAVDAGSPVATPSADPRRTRPHAGRPADPADGRGPPRRTSRRTRPRDVRIHSTGVLWMRGSPPTPSGTPPPPSPQRHGPRTTERPPGRVPVAAPVALTAATPALPPPPPARAPPSGRGRCGATATTSSRGRARPSTPARGRRARRWRRGRPRARGRRRAA